MGGVINLHKLEFGGLRQILYPDLGDRSLCFRRLV